MGIKQATKWKQGKTKKQKNPKLWMFMGSKRDKGRKVMGEKQQGVKEGINVAIP